MFLSQLRKSSRPDGSGLNLYESHQDVWSLFPEAESRDFIFRENVGFTTGFYIVSESRPECDHPGWDLAVKNYAPEVCVGDVLEFSVRVNPTVQTSKREGGRTRRVDIVQLEKSRHKRSGQPVSPDMLQCLGLKWLDDRSERAGFSFDWSMVRVLGHATHRFVKPSSDRKITLSTMDFSGQLTVSDSEVFKKTLFTGLGAAKSFGCGLMMVRRPL